jgi:hypothetical protein
MGDITLNLPLIHHLAPKFLWGNGFPGATVFPKKVGPFDLSQGSYSFPHLKWMLDPT